MKTELNFYLRTYGCQMNFHDSEILSGMLSRQNWERVGNENEADVILLNTCSVRRHAEERVLGKLAEYERKKQTRPLLVVGVLGCMAQIWGKKLWERFPWLDLILGPGSFIFLPAALENLVSSGSRRLELEFNAGAEFYDLPAVRSSPIRAWVTVMRGCNNFCAYCVVPFSRGGEVSRSPENIVREVKKLAALGYREITLLGQNVNSYLGYGRKGEKVDFSELLYRVHGVKGIERIRFVTSHPRDISRNLIGAIRDLEKVCEELHFPAQSGANPVLKRMRRDYSREEYLEKVRGLKQAVPGIALSSDFIVGFPGETDQDFEATRSLLGEVQFDQAFIFKYSSRPGTAAAGFTDNVRNEVKENRHRILLDEQNLISLARNERLLDQDVEILVEGVSKIRTNRSQGRTRTNKIAVFPRQDSLKGQLVRRRVKQVTSRALYC